MLSNAILWFIETLIFVSLLFMFYTEACSGIFKGVGGKVENVVLYLWDMLSPI